MISRQDIQRLLHRPDSEAPILSVFLDMSVDSNNKRHHELYLTRRRQELVEVAGERVGEEREALDEAFARIGGWLETSFEPENRGVAIYVEVGGDWLEALQSPVPVRNRIELSRYPVIGPLAEIVEHYHHHGVLVLDRESLRMMSVYLDRPRARYEVRGESYPAPHDIKRGGYSAKSYQKRKAEEVRHFFKEFAREVGEFERRYRPDDYIILGIEDNIVRFLDALPQALREKVAHTEAVPDAGTDAEVLERLAPYFDQERAEHEARAVELLRDRVANEYYSVSGLEGTLEQLQEGKIGTLLLAPELTRSGAECVRCGFFVTARGGACPYCRGELRDGVDLVEAMIRLAEEQDIDIHFIDARTLQDFDGAGGLLRF